METDNQQFDDSAKPDQQSSQQFKERRSGVERRKGTGQWNGVERRQNVVDRRLGLDRQRGPGRRRGDDRKAAEEGCMSDEQFEFLMAIDEYKKQNARPFPSWTEVLEVIKALGYRKVAEPAPLAECSEQAGKK
ncbi:MAG: hypothetical protein JW749_12945 [Sedimentisphaerales bacterium]|nr:hypothetical protein [Sedimentisphaerales bacterium]